MILEGKYFVRAHCGYTTQNKYNHVLLNYLLKLYNTRLYHECEGKIKKSPFNGSPIGIARLCSYFDESNRVLGIK